MKLEKSQEKKRLLKKFLKEKIEYLCQTEEKLEYSHNLINELNKNNETMISDKDRIEEYYNRELESIVNTLSSMKVYEEETIQSESLINLINRSIMDIKEENRAAQAIKNANVRLSKLVEDYEKLKTEHSILKSKLRNTNTSEKLNQMKRELHSLIKNKISSYKSELKYLKSSFNSEMSILRSSTESFVNNILLKCRETLMNSNFQKESELIKYKQSMLSCSPRVGALQKEMNSLKAENSRLLEENKTLRASQQEGMDN